MNYKLTIQYDGTDFHGWQMQGDLRTVQSEITQALRVIEGGQVTLHGSGRTDAGVHAEGQVASVALERDISPEKLQAAINANIGSDVRIVDVQPADDTFHARFSALDKMYVYRIVNGRVISPFWNRFAFHEGRKLDIERMRTGAELFLGTHDWTAFSSAQSDSESRVRTVLQLALGERCDPRAPGHLIEMTITANGFLRYMVRSIAGTLMALGREEISGDLVQEAIETGDRSLVASTAPARGLTLVSVRYD